MNDSAEPDIRKTSGVRLRLFVSQLKINPLLCRGREDLQIKVKTRARIKVGLQTTNKLTREVCQMGTENSLDNMK